MMKIELNDVLEVIGTTFMYAFIGFCLSLFFALFDVLFGGSFMTIVATILLIGLPIFGFVGGICDVKERKEKELKTINDINDFFRNAIETLNQGCNLYSNTNVHLYKDMCDDVISYCAYYYSNPYYQDAIFSFIQNYSHFYRYVDEINGKYVLTNDDLRDKIWETIRQYK